MGKEILGNIVPAHLTLYKRTYRVDEINMEAHLLTREIFTKYSLGTKAD